MPAMSSASPSRYVQGIYLSTGILFTKQSGIGNCRGGLDRRDDGRQFILALHEAEWMSLIVVELKSCHSV